MEGNMLGVGTFSEVGFSETKDIEPAVFIGSLPIMYFNSSTLTFPLKINKLCDFDLKINKLNNLSLNINKLNDFDLKINTGQEHSLTINKTLNFTTRR
jgi:hypothetical protein